MATYRINVPYDGGVITAATRSSDCISSISINDSSDPHNMISSTGITSNDITITCNENGSNNPRECTLPITYTCTTGVCQHNLHLVQSGNTMVTVYVGNHKDNHASVNIGNVQITTSHGTKTVTFDSTIAYNERTNIVVDFNGYFGTVTQVKATIGGTLTTIVNNCYEEDTSMWRTNASNCKDLSYGGSLSIVVK